MDTCDMPHPAYKRAYIVLFTLKLNILTYTFDT